MADSYMQQKRKRLVQPGKTVSITVKLLPSEYLYLNTFTSPPEGMRFIINESMGRNLSAKERQELRDLDQEAKG